MSDSGGASTVPDATSTVSLSARDSISQIAAAREKLLVRRKQLEERVATRGSASSAVGTPVATPAPAPAPAANESQIGAISTGASDGMEKLQAARARLELRKAELLATRSSPGGTAEDIAPSVLQERRQSSTEAEQDRIAELEGRLDEAVRAAGDAANDARRARAEADAARERESAVAADRDELEHRLAGEVARLRSKLATVSADGRASASAGTEASPGIGALAARGASGDAEGDERMAAYENGIKVAQAKLSEEARARQLAEQEVELAMDQADAAVGERDIADARAQAEISAREAAEARAEAAEMRAEELTRAMETTFESSKGSHARQAELSADLASALSTLKELEGVRAERDEAVMTMRDARRELELQRTQNSHLEVTLAAEREACKSLLAIGTVGQEHQMVVGLREELERLREQLAAAHEKEGALGSSLTSRDLAIEEKSEELAKAAARERKLLTEVGEMESRITQEEELQERATIRLTAELEAAELERTSLVSQLGCERAEIAEALAAERVQRAEIERELGVALHAAEQSTWLEQRVEELNDALEETRRERVTLQDKLHHEQLARRQLEERLEESQQDARDADAKLVSRTSEQSKAVDALQGQVTYLSNELEQTREKAEKREHELEEQIAEMRDDLREAQHVLDGINGTEESLAAADKLRERLALRRVDDRSEIMCIAEKLEDVQAQLEDRAVRVIAEEELPRTYEAMAELKEQVDDLGTRLQKEESLRVETERRLGAVIAKLEEERGALTEELSRERGAAASLSAAEADVTELRHGLATSEDGLGVLSERHMALQEELAEARHTAAEQQRAHEQELAELREQLALAQEEAARTGHLDGFQERVAQMSAALNKRSAELLEAERDELEVRVAQSDAALLEQQRAADEAAETLRVELSRLEREKHALLREAAESGTRTATGEHASTEQLQSRIAELADRLAQRGGEGDELVQRLSRAGAGSGAASEEGATVQEQARELVLPCLRKLHMFAGLGDFASAIVSRGRVRPFMRGEAELISKLASDCDALLVPDDVVVWMSGDGITLFLLMQGCAHALSDEEVQGALGECDFAQRMQAEALLAQLRKAAWHLARVPLSSSDPLTTHLSHGRTPAHMRTSNPKRASTAQESAPAPTGGSVASTPARASISPSETPAREPHRRVLFGASTELAASKKLTPRESATEGAGCAPTDGQAASDTGVTVGESSRATLGGQAVASAGDVTVREGAAVEASTTAPDLQARVEQLTHTVERLQKEAALATGARVDEAEPSPLEDQKPPRAAEDLKLDDLFAEVAKDSVSAPLPPAMPTSPHSSAGGAHRGVLADVDANSPRTPAMGITAAGVVSETLQKRRLQELDEALSRMRGTAPATGTQPLPHVGAQLGQPWPPLSAAPAPPPAAAPLAAAPSDAESVMTQLAWLRREMASLPLEEMEVADMAASAAAAALGPARPRAAAGAAGASGGAAARSLLPVVDELLARLQPRA